MAIPTNYILDTFGMKIGCSIGGLLVIAGTWLRTFIKEGEPIYMIGGSLLSAIGNIFILNSPSQLANTWFRPVLVPVITSLCVLATQMSITLGAAIPALILGNNPSKDSIESFLFYEAVITSGMVGLLILFLR